LRGKKLQLTIKQQLRLACVSRSVAIFGHNNLSLQIENFYLYLSHENSCKENDFILYRKTSNCETQLLIWYNEFTKLDFHNFNELKSVYGNASIINNERVVFNIKGNDYRLVVSLNFLQTACYVIWFGTHKEYDKINVETVSFDVAILNYKKR
jgi:mRNA interferase HigB